MNKHIDELTDHFIVCGYGKIGKYVCEELMARKAPFVVLEKDPTAIDSLTPLNYLYLQGDATDDDVLGNAGIGRAKGLVAALQDDADNVFATLSAKVLNPAIYIVAMAVEEESETKLLRAGASRVVKPYEAGGTRMAELLLRPGVIEFIDIVARDRQIDLNIEEISIKEGSPLSGETLAGSEIRQKLNVIIVSVHKPDGKFMFNPLFSTQLVAGDRLIAIGEESSLTQLQKLASGT
jgi:voltage-gated potassium channel